MGILNSHQHHWHGILPSAKTLPGSRKGREVRGWCAGAAGSFTSSSKNSIAHLHGEPYARFWPRFSRNNDQRLATVIILFLVFTPPLTPPPPPLSAPHPSLSAFYFAHSLIQCCALVRVIHKTRLLRCTHHSGSSQACQANCQRPLTSGKGNKRLPEVVFCVLHVVSVSALVAGACRIPLRACDDQHSTSATAIACQQVSC